MSCGSLTKHIELVDEFDLGGITAREISIGDFARTRGALITDATFDESYAECMSDFLIRIAGGCERVILALYPWVEEVWRGIAACDWIQWHRHDFARPGLFKSSSIPWVVGSARTPAKLREVINWAWTLPGRDTFIAAIAPTQDWRPLVAIFEDDHEDDGVNERKLVVPYSTIVSRGYKAMSLRLVTREYELDAIRAILEELIDG